MRRTALIPLFIFGPILVLFTTPTRAQTVVIDSNIQYQRMDGFGHSQRYFDDPHLLGGYDRATEPGGGLMMTSAEKNEVLTRLYVDLGLTRVRPHINGLIEPVNDNADPNSTDLSRFNFDWLRNDAQIDYVTRARSIGNVPTFFLSPTWLEPWMDDSTPPEEYVEWAMAILRRWRDQGLTMPYFSIVNEPGNPGGRVYAGEWLRDVIKALGPKMRAEGFETMIVTPDDLNPIQAESRSSVILADPVARAYVGALAFHLYEEPISTASRMVALGATYGLPLWMTEYSAETGLEWGSLIHTLVSDYNVSAVDLLFGFANGPQTYVRFFNNGTSYLGYELTTFYYVTGHYSKYVRPGSRRVSAIPSGTDVQVTAYLDGRSLAIVLINSHGTSRSLTISLQGLAGVDILQRVETTPTAYWASKPALPVVGSSFEVTLPSESITTLTTGTTMSPPDGGPPPDSATSSEGGTGPVTDGGVGAMGDSGGCGCRVGGPSSRSAALVLLMLLPLLLLRFQAAARVTSAGPREARWGSRRDLRPGSACHRGPPRSRFGSGSPQP